MFNKRILISLATLFLIVFSTSCSEPTSPSLSTPTVQKEVPIEQSPTTQSQELVVTKENFEKVIPVSEFIEQVLKDKEMKDVGKIFVISGTVIESSFGFTNKGATFYFVLLGQETSGYIVRFESDRSSDPKITSIRNATVGETVTIKGTYDYRWTGGGVTHIYVSNATIVK